METPTEILLKHLESVLDAFENSDSTKNAYKKLVNIPEIAAMPFNTFKVLAPAIVKTAKHINKKHEDTMDTEKAKQAIALAEEAIALAKQALDEPKQDSVLTNTDSVLTNTDSVLTQPTQEFPKKYKDWNVARCSDGYIRMNRAREEKNHESIYVGKVWNTEEVEQKLNPNQMNLLSPPIPTVEREVKIVPTQISEPPSRYKDWLVSRGKDGYIRMNKEHKGKRISVYIGKYWSEEIAEAKLAKCTL